MADDKITIMHSLSQIRMSARFIAKIQNEYDTVGMETPQKIPIDNLFYWLERWLQRKRYFSAIFVILSNLSHAFSCNDNNFLNALLSGEDELIVYTIKLCQHIETLSSSPEKLLLILLKSRTHIKSQIELAVKEDKKLSEYDVTIVGEFEKLGSVVNEVNSFIGYFEALSQSKKFHSEDKINDMSLSITVEFEKWIISQVKVCSYERFDDILHKKLEGILCMQDMSLLYAMSVSPRRLLSQALSSPSKVMHCKCCDGELSESMHDTCIAFKIKTFNTRSITFNDWFKDFSSIVEPIVSAENSEMQSYETSHIFHRFACCVYELQLCGLVKLGVTGIKNMKIERNALVWASGK